jgi:IS30 family transposase
MRGYTQLTHEERYQIFILKKAEYDQTQIAELLGRSKSTISRELRLSSSSMITPNSAGLGGV